MTVLIDTYETTGGGILVVPSIEDIQYAAHRMRQVAQERAQQGEDGVKAAEQIQAEASRTETQAADFRRDLGKHIKSLSFNVAPYSGGAEMDAKKIATNISGMTPMVDYDKYCHELLKASTGLSDKEARDLAPAVKRALMAKVQQVSEPDMERERFFASLPLNSPD